MTNDGPDRRAQVNLEYQQTCRPVSAM